MKSFSLVLITALSVQVVCQIFKVVFYSIRDKKLSLRYFFSAGGFPSAHSALVTALTTAVGLRAGFGSDIFAVAFVFAIIVIYDAYRVRGAVEKQANLLNRLTAARFPGEYERLSEMVGHTLSEVAAGVLAGGFLGWIITSALMALGF